MLCWFVIFWYSLRIHALPPSFPPRCCTPPLLQPERTRVRSHPGLTLPHGRQPQQRSACIQTCFEVDASRLYVWSYCQCDITLSHRWQERICCGARSGYRLRGGPQRDWEGRDATAHDTCPVLRKLCMHKVGSTWEGSPLPVLVMRNEKVMPRCAKHAAAVDVETASTAPQRHRVPPAIHAVNKDLAHPDALCSIYAPRPSLLAAPCRRCDITAAHSCTDRPRALCTGRDKAARTKHIRYRLNRVYTIQNTCMYINGSQPRNDRRLPVPWCRRVNRVNKSERGPNTKVCKGV